MSECILHHETKHYLTMLLFVTCVCECVFVYLRGCDIILAFICYMCLWVYIHVPTGLWDYLTMLSFIMCVCESVFVCVYWAEGTKYISSVSQSEKFEGLKYSTYKTHEEKQIKNGRWHVK